MMVILEVVLMVRKIVKRTFSINMVIVIAIVIVMVEIVTAIPNDSISAPVRTLNPKA